MYRYKFPIVILFLGLLLSSFIPDVSQPPYNSWTAIEASDHSTPVARHEAGFIKAGDQLYLLGGRGMKPVNIYDPAENKWTEGAIPPVEIHHFQPVVYDEEIYAVGAMTGNYPGETPLSHMYIYNPQHDAWREGPEIPEERRRGGAGAVLLGNELYLVCGIRDGHRGDHKKWLDVYDFKTGKWTELQDAPRPRDHFQVAIVDGKLYALGGRTTKAADNPFKNTITEVDVYDIEKNIWATLPKGLPTQRAGNFVLVHDQDILVIGGESFAQEKAHPEVEVLNTVDGTWSNWPPLPVGRHGTGAVIHRGKIYTSSGCGNRGGTPELDDLWVYSLP